MRIWSLAVLGSVLLAPQLKADTYNFYFSGQNGENAGLGIYAPYSINFVVNPIPVANGSGTLPLDNSYYYTVQVNADGGTPDYGASTNYAQFLTDGTIFLFSSLVPYDGSIAAGQGQIIAVDPSIFTGSIEAPSFKPGTTFATNYFLVQQSFNVDYDSFLTITDLSDNPVPEPSTFVLLGTGIAGVAAAMRKRIRS